MKINMHKKLALDGIFCQKIKLAKKKETLIYIEVACKK